MRRTSIARKILMTAMVLCVAVMAGIYPLTAAAISLKEKAVVTSNTLRVSDIFDGVTQDQDKVLGISPLPGREMVLDSRTLLRIALALDIGWRPKSDTDTIVIRRSATLVDMDMIQDALKTALASKNITGDYRLVLNENPDLVLPQNTAPNVEVSYINVRPESNWFEATLVAPSLDKPVATGHISGRIEKMTKIPVLKDNIDHGVIIGVNDIDYLDMPVRSLKSGMVLSADDLKGMTARRILLSGQPVLSSEIEAPQLVSRGDTVTMVFNSGGLQLTAQGKALENGARGDVIHVVNATSSKTIVAEVTNSREVTLTE